MAEVKRPAPAESVVVPPIAPFLPSPIAFGSPQYLLLQKLGNGSFGVAYVAVRARDCNLAAQPGAPMPSCAELFKSNAPLFVVKRFRKELDAEEEHGKTEEEKKKLVSTKAEMFNAERRSAAWIKEAIGKESNLLYYYHDISDPETGVDAMVFEFCNCGDIRRLVSGCKDGSGKLIHLTLFEILSIGVQLAEGLSVLHEHKIVHRDLALRNLFVHYDSKRPNDLTIKIGDFGLCVDIGDKSLPSDKKKNGIREAPEVDDVHTYDEKSDVYSLGLVLYELLSLVDLSHGTLYALNTTSLAKERVKIAGSLDKLPLPSQFAAVSRVVADRLMFVRWNRIRIQFRARNAKVCYSSNEQVQHETFTTKHSIQITINNR